MGQITIIFRVNASPEIGFGHLARCLSLAEYLKVLGCKPVFFVSDQTFQNFSEKLTNFEHKTIPSALDEIKDAKACLDFSKTYHTKAFVLDSYNLGLNWEERIGAEGYKLVVIDDLERQHKCDLLVDFNLKQNGEVKYSESSYQTLLLGSKYILIREELRRAREKLGDYRARKKQISVCFGGSDPLNASLFAMQALKSNFPKEYSVKFLLGKGYRDLSGFNAELGEHQKFSVEKDSPHLPQILADSMLAVGAGGTMNWERCLLGLPSIVITLADNQIASTQALANYGAIHYIGPVQDCSKEQLNTVVMNLLGDREARELMHKKALELVDGRGCKRVASHILSLTLDVRPAVMSDLNLVYNWRNHPDNRKTSLDAAEISLKDHSKWFAKAIESDNRYLFIVALEDQEIGVLRLDLIKDSAEVSIYLNPHFHGKKLGLAVLLMAPKLARKISPDLKLLSAKIKHENLASRSIFSDADYLCINEGKDQTYSDWEFALL